MSPYIKRTEKSQIKNLMLHLKVLERQEQTKPQTSRRRQITKLRAKINEIVTPQKKPQKNKKNSKNQ
jgi:hypothetical protein